MSKQVAVFTCLLALCNAAFIEHIKKCNINDSECQRELMQSILRDIAKTGIPELGIPPTDPYKLKDVSVSVQDLIEITLIDGVAKGVKDCIIDRYDTDVESGKATMALTCDIIVKGKYKVQGNSPIIKNLLGGGEVHGEGIGKVSLEKLHLKFNYIFRAEKINGDIYLKCNLTSVKDLKYTFSLGNVKFAANNIFLGDTEATELIVNMLNSNWKFLMENFGKPFIDKAAEIIYIESHKFFDHVPAKYYIIEDLTEYLRE